SGASVVILSVEKSEMARGNPVVKVAQAAQSSQVVELEMPGIERSFALDAPAQAPKKFHFVDAIRGAVERIGGSCKVHRRRDADSSLDLRRSLISPLAQQLEHHVAAHGEARES